MNGWVVVVVLFVVYYTVAAMVGYLIMSLAAGFGRMLATVVVALVTPPLPHLETDYRVLGRPRWEQWLIVKHALLFPFVWPYVLVKYR